MWFFRSTPILSASVALLVGCSLLGPSHPDLSSIGRRIVREPEYVTKIPLYGLFVFDSEASTSIWAALDKSSKDRDLYDVLYLDLNSNGDLTEGNERFEGRVVGAGTDESVEFLVGSLFVSTTGHTHTEVMISASGGSQPRVFFEMKWNGEHKVGGGYPRRPGSELVVTPRTRFAPRPEDAPILWPGAEVPLSFQDWHGGVGLPTPRRLSIGGSHKIQMYLGHAGKGTNTFCALPDDFLPENVPIITTLIYTDVLGETRRAVGDERDRCCGILYYGRVNVPTDARPGMATVHVELPSDYPCVPEDIPVELVPARK